MKSEIQIAIRWRDYFSRQVLVAKDKAHYEEKAAEWTGKARRLILRSLLAE